MLKRLPSTHPRPLWIALSLLLVAAIVGTLVTALREHDQPVGAGTGLAASPTASVTSPRPLVVLERTSSLPGVAADDSATVGGLTNHLDFARAVAQQLLAYDYRTDFPGRNADLLRAAAPAPYGDPVELTDLLDAYTPTGAGLQSIRDTQTTVTVALSEVTVSSWAARKLSGRGVSTGVYGIDITGVQTVSNRNEPPIQVSVLMGVTMACPPAVEFCTLAGVFPQHLQEALGPR